MLSNVEFIKQSLALHLFFARIMKEHSFFLEAGFSPRDTNFTQRADAFRREYDGLLGEAVSLSNGVVSPDVLQSGEVITPFTLNAERVTAFYTGVQIPFQLTQAEAGLVGSNAVTSNPMLEQRVFVLNQRAIKATQQLIQFKRNILTNVLSCRMFTFNYPLLILHIMREAELYLQQLTRLQRKEQINLKREAYELEFFWNRQMAEHAKFIRGLLDPTEDDLINQANDFGKEFDQLTEKAKEAIDANSPPDKITDESLKATEDLRNFKAQGTQGILSCQVKSIIIPLLGDHVLREANHYLRLLKMFE
ncbi:MAG TPA: DUF2935 domain-containing protein [Acetivibrio sp.]|jgi:hypothetical protein|nr:DUF2935 domain-containing protein [Clostridium sp.]HQA58048.1 DUF2935 domain-containing protein [Acetivibrio sp.]